MAWNVQRPTSEGQRAILILYVDDDLFHGKATNKGIRYKSVLDWLQLSTNQLAKDKELFSMEKQQTKL